MSANFINKRTNWHKMEYTRKIGNIIYVILWLKTCVSKSKIYLTRFSPNHKSIFSFTEENFLDSDFWQPQYPLPSLPLQIFANKNCVWSRGGTVQRKMDTMSLSSPYGGPNARKDGHFMCCSTRVAFPKMKNKISLAPISVLYHSTMEKYKDLQNRAHV